MNWFQFQPLCLYLGVRIISTVCWRDLTLNCRSKSLSFPKIKHSITAIQIAASTSLQSGKVDREPFMKIIDVIFLIQTYSIVYCITSETFSTKQISVDLTFLLFINDMHGAYDRKIHSILKKISCFIRWAAILIRISIIKISEIAHSMLCI